MTSLLQLCYDRAGMKQRVPSDVSCSKAAGKNYQLLPAPGRKKRLGDLFKIQWHNWQVRPRLWFQKECRQNILLGRETSFTILSLDIVTVWEYFLWQQYQISKNICTISTHSETMFSAGFKSTFLERSRNKPNKVNILVFLPQVS